MRSSSLFRTYDGVEIIAHRMLGELFAEYRRLYAEDGVVIKKISFVGYSLGGLVVRYMIGELEKLKFFDEVEPVYFTTFASPHVGVFFYKKRYKLVSYLGECLLGLAGREMFIRDKRKLLVELCEGPYFSGLEKFHKRFLFANAKHDRTVSFYTSFISDKDPFGTRWDDLKLDCHLEQLSRYKIRGQETAPSIVNLDTSRYFEPGEAKDAKKWFNYRKLFLLAGLPFLLTLWIPVFLITTTVGTVYSYFVVYTFKKKPFELVILGKEKIDDITGQLLEDALNMDDYDGKSSKSHQLAVTKSASNGKVYNKHVTVVEAKSTKLYEVLDRFKSSNLDRFNMFSKTAKLPFDSDRRFIHDKLNSLEWIKFPVFLDVLNAHNTIIGRRGTKNADPRGLATLYMWSELLLCDMERAGP